MRIGSGTGGSGGLIRAKEDARSPTGARGGLVSFDVDGDGEVSIWWTVAYYVLLVTGAVGFKMGLWRLTESENKLAEF